MESESEEEESSEEEEEEEEELEVIFYFLGLNLSKFVWNYLLDNQVQVPISLVRAPRILSDAKTYLFYF